MNIRVLSSEPVSHLLENQNLNEDHLVESYLRSRNLEDFLNENGNTQANQIIYWTMSLNESMVESQRFEFENGMFIPGISEKVTGRLSLTNICENSKNEDEFVDQVSKEICENRLFFTPTPTDIQNLKEHFNEHKRLG